LKTLVFLLVLGNVLFYALSNGLLGHADNPDAGRVNQQIEVERIKIVSRGEAPAASKVVEKPAEKAAEPPVTKPEEKKADICLRWEHLSATDANRLEALLKEKFSSLSIKRQAQISEGSSWWVYIPPLPGKAEADKKAGELRQLGITDYFILQDNNANRFAISLGLFSTEKGSQDRLAELKEKGVKSARVSVRPGKDAPANLEASGPLPDKILLSQASSKLLPKNPALNCK
jgi:hypothetical protein